MFCHLHVHNEFSVLDGYGTAEQYAERAAQLGFKYLALTNHGNIDGLLQWQEACEAEGIQPIMGCEAYIVKDALVKEKGEKRYHITLLIKNQKGFRNLNKLLTYANLEGFYHRPRIDYKTLLKHIDGLFVLTGCCDSFLNDPAGGEKFFKKLIRKISRGNIALEIMPHDMDIQRKHNERCFELQLQTGVPMVATNDCHYVKPSDWEVQEVLLAIQSRAKWSDPDRWRFGIKNLHLRSYKQMKRAFEKYHRLNEQEVEYALRNTVNVAKKCCGFRIKRSKVRLPNVDIPKKYRNENDYLYHLCDGSKVPLEEEGEWPFEYWQRFQDELELIKEKRFARYFLIVKDLLNWCDREGVMYGPGRGSVGGSLVAYLLGITAVDPIQFGTIFDRFINKDRIDYPDIDLDFEDTKRDRVRFYLEEKYGVDRVVGIGTVLRMKTRNAIRDVARVFEVDRFEVDAVSKAIDLLSFKQAKESFEMIDEATDEVIVKFKRKYPHVFDFARRLEGQVRAYGQHAAALVLSPVALSKGSKGHLVRRKDNLLINWDMWDAEKLGLLKIDILGLNTLTVLNETRRLVNEES